MVKFDVGQTVATPGAIEDMEAAGVTPTELLDRHTRGDWGDMCEEDLKQNEVALEHDLRIFSSYNLGPDAGNKCLWVITEADRSSTTILRPEDY